MSHITVALGISGIPRELPVAPGTAIVMWVPALAASLPFIVCQTEPNTGAIRVPLASMASRSFCPEARSPPSAYALRVCSTRSRLPSSLHCTAKEGVPALSERS